VTITRRDGRSFVPCTSGWVFRSSNGTMRQVLFDRIDEARRSADVVGLAVHVDS